MLQWPKIVDQNTARPLASNPLSSPATSQAPLQDGPEMAIVIPTFNECGNIAELLERLRAVLQDLSWEVLFVDDDSPDGTAACIAAHARQDPRIRLLQRVGRRGLSSACVEGLLATTAPYVAIMDADLQHDEAALPAMLSRLRAEKLDLVIGTRNASGGSMGGFCPRRQALSRFGQRTSHLVCRTAVSDPMSGFFLLDRSFFLETVHRLYGGGFKILLDILSSASRPVRFAEVGYTFRLRRRGTSKLDVNTAVEYLFLVLHKLTGGLLPSRFAAFSLVGTAGAITHLLIMTALLYGPHWHFLHAQIAATYVAMTENFFLNNLITWRDRNLRGVRLVTGLASFWIVCSFGAWADVILARALLQTGSPWPVAAVAGIVLSSVWNYSMANLFTWQKAKAGPTPPALSPSEQFSKT